MSTWYRTGTIALTNGSATVTGTGTAWIANASVGEGLVAPDGRIYEITNIGSDTSITISPAYLGSTASGRAYAIAPLRGRIAQLLSETSSLLSSFATVRDGIGAGLFPNGTASAPALRAAADQDTGLFFPAANTLALVTGGVRRATIDSSGNVGIGTSAPTALLHVEGGSVRTSASYIVSGAGELRQSLATGGISLNTNGANGIAFETGGTPAERMRISNAGNVGIGTSSPATLLDVSQSADAAVIARVVNVNAGVSADARFLASNGTTQSGIIVRGTGHSSANHLVLFQSSTTAPMTFFANGSERMRITSAGVVRPGADNTQSFGEASFRWSTIFAGTGTINTSDERDKQWRGPLNAAELRAAKRIAAEIGIYQFLDSIAEKGAANARLHCGVRAQQVFAILEDEGLEWSAYAWCCHDEWEETPPQPAAPEVLDDEGQVVEPARPAQPAIPAGDRYGIRPDQLALWLIAAQEQRLLALEAVA